VAAGRRGAAPAATIGAPGAGKGCAVMTLEQNRPARRKRDVKRPSAQRANLPRAVKQVSPA